jgi:hypothetical protein
VKGNFHKIDIQITMYCVLLLFVVIICTVSFTSIQTVEATSYSVDYNVYHNLTSIYTQLDLLQRHPLFTRYVTIIESPQRTILNNRLILIQLRDKHNSQNHEDDTKLLPVLITFGEHAREFITVESAFDLIYYLLDSLLLCDTNNEENCQYPSVRLTKWIFQHIQLDLVPILNPDGRTRLEAIANDPTRKYDKSRMCWRNNGQGVDLNRNADWEYGGEGSSARTNHEEYRGKHAFSEIETQYIRDLAANTEYIAYVSIHSGEKQFFTPFVDTVSRRLKRTRTPQEIANNEIRLGQLIMLGSGDWFRNWGKGWEMNSYSADGTIYDWMAGKMNVPYCYCAEMWGDSTGPQPDDCFIQFNPAPENLHKDLVKMRRFYLAFLMGLIQVELDKSYPYDGE